MILVLRPAGRGNWKPLILAVHSGPVELLFPALRDGAAKVGDRWTIQGREWRLSAVDGVPVGPTRRKSGGRP